MCLEPVLMGVQRKRGEIGGYEQKNSSLIERDTFYYILFQDGGVFVFSNEYTKFI